MRAVAAALLRKRVDENAYAEISQEDYALKYAVPAERYESLTGNCNAANGKILRQKHSANRIKAFFKTKALNDIITEFDDGLWNVTVDTVPVTGMRKAFFEGRHGNQIAHIKSRRRETNYSVSVCGINYSLQTVANG